jgi:hypothetical protein
MVPREPKCRKARLSELVSHFRSGLRDEPATDQLIDRLPDFVL